MADDKKGINPFATGIAGAVIGAAAAAAAMVLSDEKNRKKAEKILGELEKDGSKVIKEVTRIALELRDKAQNTKTETKGSKKVAKKVASKKK